MSFPRPCFALLLLCLPGVLADYLTPTYPAPIDLSSNASLVSASWKNLTATFDDFLKNKTSSTSNPVSGVENVTFSVELFSLHDPAATKLQYHYTAPEIASAKQGTNKVDGDSIYRVASVSKLVTTLAGLVTMSEQDWNRPLAEIIPGLGAYSRAHSEGLNPLYTPQWDKITPWALVTQLSGIATLGWPAADLAVQFAAGQISPAIVGLPPYNVSSLGPCATGYFADPPDTYCSGPDAIQAVAGQAPNFLPWTTPAYSDQGFMLLGIAISNITGKPMSAVYQDSVFKPLAMSSSNDTHPTAGPKLARSVISGDPALNFALETGFTTPSGGILSTVNDLSKLGIGILNNTLISAETTRKWMKPQSHTASLSYSIGGSWEIHRYVHPSSGKTTDLYTKLGDSGYYGGALVLIPQYDAGFTLLNAYSNQTIRSPAALLVLDYITNAILPALEAQAAAEAMANYVGTYTYAATNGSLNSSVTIGFNESNIPGITSGLTVTKWISNGTDVLASGLFSGLKPRLEPSIPKQTPDGAAGQVAFQLSTRSQLPTYTAAMDVPGSGVIGTWTGFYTTNGDFAYTDSSRYGDVGVNMFVFDVDAEGRATACSPAVDRVTLKREK